MMIKASYPLAPIPNIEALSRGLDVPVSELYRALELGGSQYIEVSIPKSDGSRRTTFKVLEPLRTIQQRIDRCLLKRCEFPDYLTGSVRKRDRLSNARVHSGARTLISLDVASYFDNVKAQYVHKIFRELMRFSEEVSKLLTDLTTRDGRLPQGSSSSPSIANLLLFQREPWLVRVLGENGIRYTRYVDDINMSSTVLLGRAVTGRAISFVKRMLAKYELKLKDSKSQVCGQSERMLVNKLVVNRWVSIARSKRMAVKAAAHNALLGLEQNDPLSIRLVDSPARLKGRIQDLRRLHPATGQRLLDALEAIHDLGAP